MLVETRVSAITPTPESKDFFFRFTPVSVHLDVISDLKSGPTGCIGSKLNVFNPTWPNTCPYVTNVGATKVYPGKTVWDPESAVFDPAGHPYSVNYSSGGGFSNVFPIPDYQQDAVATFFKEHNPPYPYYSALAPDTNDIQQMIDIDSLVGNTGGIYNRIGRGVPDVAANGDNIVVCGFFFSWNCMDYI